MPTTTLQHIILDNVSENPYHLKYCIMTVLQQFTELWLQFVIWQHLWERIEWQLFILKAKYFLTECESIHLCDAVKHFSNRSFVRSCDVDYESSFMQA